MSFWFFAYRNLFRNLRRTISTGIAIMAGFVGLILLSAYIYRVQRGLEVVSVYVNHKGHIAVFKEDSVQKYSSKPEKFVISPEEQEKIKAIFDKHNAEIEFTGKYLSGAGLLTIGEKSSVFLGTGIEPEAFKKVYNHSQIKEWASDWMVRDPETTYNEMLEDGTAISITAKLGELVAKEPPFRHLSEDAKSVQLVGRSFYNDLNAANANLALVHTTGIAMIEDTSMYAPLPLLQELYATEGIQYWAVFLKDRTMTSSFAKTLKQDFKNAGLKLDVRTFEDDEWSPYYVGTLNFLYVMGMFFIFLICGAVALSVMNSTTLGIMERIREVGTLRAVGFNASDINRLFMQENVLLSILSLIGGLIVASVIILAVNNAHIQFRPPGAQGEVQFLLILSPLACFIAALGVVVITLLTTFLVVRKLSRKQVIQLLTDSGA